MTTTRGNTDILHVLVHFLRVGIPRAFGLHGTASSSDWAIKAVAFDMMAVGVSANAYRERMTW